MTPTTRNPTTLAGRQKVGRFVLLVYGQVCLAVASFLALPALVFYPRTDAWKPWRVLLGLGPLLHIDVFRFACFRRENGLAKVFCKLPWIAAASAGLGVLLVVPEAYGQRRPHSITDTEAAWLIASVLLFAPAGYLLCRRRPNPPVR